MAKVYKPGFLYIYSDIIKQEVAMSNKTGWVYCEDKDLDGELVKYSPKEIQIMKNAGMEITPAIHNVKKVLGGEIVNGSGPGTIDKGKCFTEPGADSAVNIPDKSGEIQGSPGDGKKEREGDLGLF